MADFKLILSLAWIQSFSPFSLDSLEEAVYHFVLNFKKRVCSSFFSEINNNGNDSIFEHLQSIQLDPGNQNAGTLFEPAKRVQGFGVPWNV